MDYTKICQKLCEFINQAERCTYIRKPYSWALYQTWKWCDKAEKERRRKE